MNPLRTAILGCGGFARRHAQLLAEMPEQANLVAFCDRNQDRAEAYAAEFTDGKAAIFTDHHRLIDEAQLDLLVICLPPYGHSDEVAYAASHGVHIFIEKPIALTSQQAWSMVEAVETAGIVTQVGFMFRFGAAVARLKQLIDSGEAGPVGLMTARYFCNSLHAGWWRERDKSGGQLVEQVIHMVDLMRYLMGDASTVYSLQQNLFHQGTPNYTVEDVSGTVFGFANGGIGTISASNGAIPGLWTNDYRVVTQNVTVEFTDANHATLVHTAGGEAGGDPATEILASDEDVYKLEFLDLFEAIRNGRPAQIPMREGAKSLDLALAATRSAETGMPVSLAGNKAGTGD